MRFASLLMALAGLSVAAAQPVQAEDKLTEIENETPNLALPWEPWCARGYRHESYGLGLGHGFKGLKPVKDGGVYFDRVCYQLGYDKGDETVRAHENWPGRCESAFVRGRKDGFAARIERAYIPSDCSHSGYAYGQALLNRGARAGDAALVGSACVGEYERGYNDAVNRMAAVVGTDNRLNQCYQTGYQDGLLYPDPAARKSDGS